MPCWAVKWTFIKNLYLFGSRATGKWRSKSDVDIAAEIEVEQEELHMPGELRMAPEDRQYFLWMEEKEEVRRSLKKFVLSECKSISHYRLNLDGLHVKKVKCGVQSAGILLYKKN